MSFTAYTLAVCCHAVDLTVSGCVVGAWNENDLLIGAHHRLHFAVERRARRPNQHEPVLAFDRLQSLRQLLLQPLRVRLSVNQ